jgi:hypothetical protein
VAAFSVVKLKVRDCLPDLGAIPPKSSVSYFHCNARVNVTWKHCKGKCKDVSLQATKAWVDWGEFQSLVTSALDGAERSTSRTGLFVPGGGEIRRTHLVEGWVGPTAGLGKRDKRLARAGNRTTIFRTPSRQLSHYTNCPSPAPSVTRCVL